METKKINRILLWATIILFITNLTMAISFLTKNISGADQITTDSGKPTDLPDQLRARTFGEQLNLSSDQLNQFRNFTQNYNRSANQITRTLEDLRIEMVTELGKENPDSARLKSFTQKMGMLHTELKNMTVAYYENLNKICKPDQRIKLNEIFMSMVSKGENAKPQQQGGWRHRYGRQQKN
jgi:Spy/CpxP family protein refolding chaperone